jgi:hypothetical protein
MIKWDTLRFWGSGGRRQVPPLVQVVEPIDGPWVNDPAFGNQIKKGPMNLLFPTAGTAQSVVKTDDTPGPPRVHTVQLFRGDDRTANNADFYAKVSYGVGGVNNSFLVDWAMGAQFSLVASSLSVEAVSYRPDETIAYTTNTAEIVLAATIGQGTIARGPVLTMTEPLRTLVAADEIQLTVPDFARAFILRFRNLSQGLPADLGGSNPATQTLLNVLAVNGFANPFFHMDAQIFAGPMGAHGLPLPGGTVFVRVHNNTNTAAGPPLQNNDYQIIPQWVLSL